MSREYEENERAMVGVQRRQEGNGYCADCGGGRPEYVNLTVGTFICKECADVHRSISNRRVKDVYGRDLTREDVRRMADVGNDKANRRFLATWDPAEFPEPDPADKDRLQNFIWLKYEGSWKKAPAPTPAHRYERDARDARYGRERELFQDVPQHRAEQEPQPRSVWAERMGRRPQQVQPPVNTLPPRHDDYRRYEGGVERFAREPAMNRDRFRAPAHTGYGRRMDGGLPPSTQSRYREEYDEEYDRRSDRRRDSGRSDRRDSGRSDYRSSGRTEPQRRRDEGGRRKKSSRYASEEEEEDLNDGVVEKRRQRKATKSRREVAQDSEEESSDEDYASRSKKAEKKKKKGRSKTAKKKRRDETESDSDDAEDEDDVDSLPSTTPDSAQKGKTAVSRASPPAKAEFDLMSDWMGAETETNTTVQSSTSAVTQPPTTQAAPMQMAPQPGVQMPPMVAPPMSMYGGMMPNPHAAYMTGMPYYMTGVPMGMGMGGMQMMPPPHPQMGMPGVMSGMAAMNLGGQQQAQPQQAQPQQAQPQPPPPPPPQMQQNGPVPPPPSGPPPS